MIIHPDLDSLRAFTDSELTPRRRRRIAAHLAGCTECREKVGWTREVREAIRQRAKLSAPRGAWERIAARALAGEAIVLPVDDAAARRGGGTGLRRSAAAVILLIFVAGIAWAAPGSPLRSWLMRVWAPPAAVSDPATGPITESGAALYLEPLDGSVAISINDAAPRLRIRVRLIDGDVVEVHASGTAAAARFRSARGRLGISNTGAGEIDLWLPRSTDRATLRVNGELYLEKQQDEIRIVASDVDTAGAEFILRVRQ